MNCRYVIQTSMLRQLSMLLLKTCLAAPTLLARRCACASLDQYTACKVTWHQEQWMPWKKVPASRTHSSCRME